MHHLFPGGPFLYDMILAPWATTARFGKNDDPPVIALTRAVLTAASADTKAGARRFYKTPTGEDKCVPLGAQMMCRAFHVWANEQCASRLCTLATQSDHRCPWGSQWVHGMGSTDAAPARYAVRFW